MASGRLRRAAALEARDAVLQLFSQDKEGESASDQSEGTVAHIADIHGDPNDILSDEEDTAPVAEILPHQEPHPRTQPPDKWTDKNGNIWSTEAPPYQGRRGNADILRQRPGPTRDAVKNNIVETWNIFIPDDMLQKIVRHSQEKASALGFQIELTVTQLKAFIGILYFRGANGDQHIPANDLWSSKYSIFYRAAMSRNLFNMWSRCLRFDNSEDRQARKVTDTYAAFRDLWEEWNARLREFLITLATDLAIPHMRWRSANPIGLQASLVSAIRHFTGEQHRPAAAVELTPATRVRCTRCIQPQPGVAKKEPNKTSKRCNTCHEPVCGTHSTALVTCNECLL